MDWWRSAWRLKLGECTCKSIPLLIPVASLSRYPDAISSCLALSGPRRIDGGLSVEIKLGEGTWKSIPLLIPVASLCRYPDAVACLVVRSLDRDGLVEVSMEIKIR